ncbi:tRNA (adenosine(37)-N6)-threonylcarbamoyltransferase complex ATPase subunit type 1 TsaE [Candidatus Saccharibacteria bacterium]|nr:tRNA (adenosine(37)-N6)-threonylcarbamoyltransferase complex ATPase subunit type 1 TsaE [Candidatus Saccharibacteria bacterium]
MKSKVVQTEANLIKFGQKLGKQLMGGEVLELIGDLGAGKTTFAKGLALGLGIKATVNSPSFTIMKEYTARDGLTLKHYDFYRLDDAGLMKNEIKESAGDAKTIVVVEWAKEVVGVLPKNRLIVEIEYAGGEGRVVKWT